ncbi:MAG: FmdB family zinc ribbon protein [Actinomycetota bacterium]
MPTYEYRCGKCGQHVEVYQSFAEEPLTKHEACGGKLIKVLAVAGIVLKGSGFYKTDSRGKKKSAASSSSSSSSESSDSSAKESKSESKSSEPGSSSSSDAKTA